MKTKDDLKKRISILEYQIDVISAHLLSILPSQKQRLFDEAFLNAYKKKPK